MGDVKVYEERAVKRIVSCIKMTELINLGKFCRSLYIGKSRMPRGEE
jgi:hypothetical protein